MYKLCALLTLFVIAFAYANPIDDDFEMIRADAEPEYHRHIKTNALRKKYTARLVILYDNSFKAIFPKAEEKVKQIMKEVGKLYKKFGTSEIEFKVVKIAHVKQDYSWKTFFGMEDSR